MALCVHPEFTYVKAKDPATGRVYIVAESRLKDIPGAVPKPKKGKKGTEATPQEGGWQVVINSYRLDCKMLDCRKVVVDKESSGSKRQCARPEKLKFPTSALKKLIQRSAGPRQSHWEGPGWKDLSATV